MTVLNKRAVHLQSIELDSTSSSFFNDLGVSIAPGQVVQLPDGMEATQLDLFKRAVELDPSDATALCNLAVASDGTERIQVRDGTLWSKRGL
mmetsp:Transcript_115688/g.223007  ORF Transcript_115688/g.223007 Transcript_115688/m.223007 type:complete len:92 (-) Transcript_115688:14-289(-)